MMTTTLLPAAEIVQPIYNPHNEKVKKRPQWDKTALRHQDRAKRFLRVAYKQAAKPTALTQDERMRLGNNAYNAGVQTLKTIAALHGYRLQDRNKQRMFLEDIAALADSPADVEAVRSLDGSIHRDFHLNFYEDFNTQGDARQSPKMAEALIEWLWRLAPRIESTGLKRKHPPLYREFSDPTHTMVAREALRVEMMRTRNETPPKMPQQRRRSTPGSRARGPRAR